MPPESIIYGLFTVKSDVWAFGVLMWEVFSLGQLPYLGLSNEEAIEAVRSGQTMSRPNEFCPDDVYEVMLSCWSKHSDKRPTFNEILDNL
jgi:serine/threonine protein kinase